MITFKLKNPEMDYDKVELEDKKARFAKRIEKVHEKYQDYNIIVEIDLNAVYPGNTYQFSIEGDDKHLLTRIVAELQEANN